MLILFDNGTPRTLARHLIDHHTVTEARAPHAAAASGLWIRGVPPRKKIKNSERNEGQIALRPGKP